MKILQIGLGGFGKNHLRAWAQMGLARHLSIADLSQERLKEAQELFGIAADRLVTDYRALIQEADVVDVVTPSDSHYAICAEALRLGKDVFVEKPMTMTSQEADQLAEAVEQSGRILQVGYYYRFHPISQYVREQIRNGQLGSIRYLSGQFMGFKRARTDVGVTHTDGIHFIDLFNSLIGETPREAYAVIRDHFGRGMEDFSIVLLQYPSGVVAKVESGYVQPGNWVDRVVPNAMTTKDITVVGDRRTIRADYEIDKVEVFEVRHELQKGIWTPVHGSCTSPRLRSVTPVELVALELQSFLDLVFTEGKKTLRPHVIEAGGSSKLGMVGRRATPEPNVVASGTVLARIMEAVYQSAASGQPASIDQEGEGLDSLPLQFEESQVV